MTMIKSEDVISSIADSLQYISCYHPKDFVEAMYKAYKRERNKAARDAIGQILINSKMCAVGRRPICQDTGIVSAFVKLGMRCQFDTDMTIQEMIDEGTRRAYTNPDNPLRKSVVAPAAYGRKNTGTNAPAVVHIEMVPGNEFDVHIAAKGGGSENKSKMAMLTPADSIVEWVTESVPKMGAGWCPPGILGIGIGGTIDKAMCLAKESLMDPVDIQDLIANGPQNELEQLRLELYEAVNKLGIGAQGLGGLTTVLDVKIKDCPTHAASMPVAIIPNCAATRHIHFKLDGSGPVDLVPPPISDWPDVSLDAGDAIKRVNLDGIDKKEIASWKAGDTLLLNGKILTGRDAAHKRLKGLIDAGKPLPEGVDFNGRFIYYVGPVDPVGSEVVGPAGPTTSTRMDKYSEMMLVKTGLFGMIGKSERGDQTIDLIKKHQAVYLMAVGGAAYLVSKAIKKSRIVAFEDLGMEAIYEFEVEDMPVTVAVDSNGEAVHKTGPQFWQQEIRNMA
ncbi:MAG: fumarate hydratase [Proteobacteria bacterium]|nr:MAG: fumarate hydratase [Pseudomonadota bacterium]PIE64345.1 MAG: fumarate hydratase [Desulfobacterales bacterium]